ncbi:MAG: hypothetical protein ACFFE5_14350 [Candidatus Thorarchaeota archaeon]
MKLKERILNFLMKIKQSSKEKYSKRKDKDLPFPNSEPEPVIDPNSYPQPL